MVALLAFAVTLLVAVLVSDLAHRSILSTSVLFLVAGFVTGDGALGVISLRPNEPLVQTFAELALFSVLFTDGMRVGVRDLVSAWRLPGRALLLGMPITFGLMSILARFVVGLSWTNSFLVGAVLAPTDPVFAAAIVGREDVPLQLRHLLNVESGLNDGLALPVVVLLLAVSAGGHVAFAHEAGALALGVALGVAIPLAAIALERVGPFSAASGYQPLYAFSIGLLVLATCKITGANLFLAAFAGGITVASVGPEIRSAFHRFGDLVAELLKLAALMIFGALISPSMLARIPPAGYVFAVLAVVLARPVGLGVSLLGSKMDRRERAAAAWFGPKGFASVVYGLLVLQSGIPGATEIYQLIAVAIALSILAHSSTDVIVARGFREEAPGAV
jgi:NhaP-type Na+/H+ or K+/H+ antiporter